MPARIVVVHNDADFLACVTGALTQRGDNVAGFRDAGAALKALEAAKSVDVLITGIGLDGPQGIGLSLARVARTARPGVKVLFVARPAYEHITKGVGDFLPAPAKISDVVAVVEQMLQSDV